MRVRCLALPPVPGPKLCGFGSGHQPGVPAAHRQQLDSLLECWASLACKLRVIISCHCKHCLLISTLISHLVQLLIEVDSLLSSIVRVSNPFVTEQFVLGITDQLSNVENAMLYTTGCHGPDLQCSDRARAPECQSRLGCRHLVQAILAAPICLAGVIARAVEQAVNCNRSHHLTRMLTMQHGAHPVCR